MTKRARLQALALVISATFLANSTLLGATLTYDADTAIAGAQDGAGLGWNTTELNWWDGAANVAWPNMNIDEAIFGAGSGAAGSVTVGTVTANKLTFNAPGSGNYTLTGGTITLAGTTPTISTAVGTAPIISSVLAGTSGLIKEGPGSLTLNTANTFSGGLTVNSGTVTATVNANFDGGVGRSFGTGNITVNSGGIITGTVAFSVSGGNATTRTINLKGGTWNAAYVAGGGEYFNTVNMTAGTITAPSGFLRTANTAGAGTITTSAASASSTIAIGIDMTWGSLSVNVAAGSVPANGADLIMNGPLSQNTGAGSGNKSFTKLGAGKLTWTGTAANTYTGLTTVSAGTLSIEKGNNVNSIVGDLLIQSGGIVSLSTGASNRINDVSNVTVTGVGSQFIVGDNLTEVIAGLTVSNGGLVTIGTTNTTLRPTSITSSGGGTIGGNTSQMRLNFLAANRTINVTDNTLTLGIGVTNGAITKTGAGTLLFNVASDYSLGTTVNGGTAIAAVGNSFGTGSVTVNAGGTITGIAPFSIAGGNANTRTINLNGGTWNASYATTGGEYVRTLNMTGGLISSVNPGFYLRVPSGGQNLNSLASATTSTIQMGIDMTLNSIVANVAAGTTPNGVDLWIQGALTENVGDGSGAKSLTKSGAGKLLLSGINVYTGTTTINEGTLEIGGSGTLGGVSGAYAPAITNNGTLQFSTTGAQTLSGVMSGTGAVTLKGSGLLTLSNAANTYTGNTTVNAGTLVVSGGITSAAMVNGGTLKLDGTSTKSITVNSTGILTGAGSTTDNILLNNGSGILAGTVAVQGATVTATGTNVYVTGTPSGAAATLDVIRYAGGTTPLAGLSPAANYRSGAYTDDTAKIQLTYTAEAKTWNTTNGTWDVNGASSPWTGGSDGKFYWGDSVTIGGTGAKAITVVGNVAPSSVLFNNTTGAITLSGAGSIVGAAGLTISAADSAGVIMQTINSYTGVTTVGSGTLSVSTIGNAGTAGNLGLNPMINVGLGALAGRFTYTGAGETTDRVINFNGTIGGAFITNSGTGLLRFTSNTTTTGSGGKGTFFGGTSDLQFDGNITALGGVLNMTKNDANTLTLGGVVTTGNGTLTANLGTLNVNGVLNTGTGNINTAGSSTVNVNGAATILGLILSQTAATTSTMNVNSGGTLTITGNANIGWNANTTAGILNIKTGATLNTATNVFIGGAGSNTTTATGTVTLETGATWNMTTAASSIYISSGTNTVGTLNLNGGTLILNGQIRNDVAVGTGILPGASTLNLNGSTLRAAGASTTFINTIDTVNVRNGGVIFDTNGFAVTVPDSLDHSVIVTDNAIDGGLTKIGTGTLTLSGTNTYTGNTSINSGILAIDGAGSLGAGGNYAGSISNLGTLQFSTSAAQTISGVISGSGSFLQSGSGTTTLSAANTYSGTTTVNAGSLIVTGSLANNGIANILMAANDDTLAGNALLTRPIAAGLNTYAGFGSKVTATSLDPVLAAPLQTTAAILMSGTNTAANNMTMQWRTRTVAEAAASNPNAVLSDVVSLTEMGSDIVVLQMSYTDAVITSLNLNEAAIATSGELRLGWKNGATWTTAVDGNDYSGGGAANFVGMTSWNTYYTTLSSVDDGSDLSSFLGAYGVDPTNNVVWAVVNHNSEFAVIPEPSTWVLGGLALLGFARVGLRRRRTV